MDAEEEQILTETVEMQFQLGLKRMQGSGAWGSAEELLSRCVAARLRILADLAEERRLDETESLRKRRLRLRSAVAGHAPWPSEGTQEGD